MNIIEYQKIIEYVGNYIKLTEEEKEQFCSFLRIITLKKKQCIVQPDFVCRYRSYVVHGGVKAYLHDENFQEHTIAFAFEDWWITDYNSYIFQQPATLFVEALEKTVLIQIEYNQEQELLLKIPKFERFFRIITQNAYASLQRRVISTLSKRAEERYEDFIKQYPTIVQRVPQYVLASYLGMSTEYLSKLRKRRVTLKT